jgi:hypothetical protein
MALFNFVLKGFGRGVIDTTGLDDLEMTGDLAVGGDVEFAGSSSDPIFATDASADEATANGAWAFGGDVSVAGDVEFAGSSTTPVFSTDASADAIAINGTVTADIAVAGSSTDPVLEIDSATDKFALYGATGLTGPISVTTLTDEALLAILVAAGMATDDTGD